MTAWVVTCSASIVTKSPAQYTQPTRMVLDTFRNTVKRVDGSLILSKYRRRFNEICPGM